MTHAEPSGLQALIDYCQQKGRICPQPTQWNELHELLPDKRSVGVSWEPPLPFILAAWWDTPLLLKVMRFREHQALPAKRSSNGTLTDKNARSPDVGR
jgi:hypothetical protein